MNAAYAVMINRDELVETFRNLEEPVIRRRINDMQEISNRLIQILGGAAIRINLGDEPVILVAEALSPTEIMEMDKDKLLAVVALHGSTVSHASIMAKTMEIPTLVGILPLMMSGWNDCNCRRIYRHILSESGCGDPTGI